MRWAVIVAMGMWPALAWAGPSKPAAPAGSKVLEQHQEGDLASVLYEARGPASRVVAHYRATLARRGMTVQVSKPEPVDGLHQGGLVKIEGQAVFGRSRTEVATISLSTQPDGKVRIRAEWCRRIKAIDAANLAAEIELPFPGVTTGGFPDLITLDMICDGRLPAFVQHWQASKPRGAATGQRVRKADFSSGLDDPPKPPPSLHGTADLAPKPDESRVVLKHPTLQIGGPLARNRISVAIARVSSACTPPVAMLGKVVRASFVIAGNGAVLGAEITGSSDTNLITCVRKQLLAAAYPRTADGQPTHVNVEWKVAKPTYTYLRGN